MYTVQAPKIIKCTKATSVTVAEKCFGKAIHEVGCNEVTINSIKLVIILWSYLTSLALDDTK